MDNRFKYRVWAGQNYVDDFMPCCIIPTGKLACANSVLNPNVYVIEQCTGLTDKNGKLIYEGDVVRFLWQLKDNEVCKIIWDKNHCSFACVDIKTGAVFITWYSVFENGQSNRCEIIGNIHKPGQP